MIDPMVHWSHVIGSKIIGLKQHWIGEGLDLCSIGLANDCIYGTLDLSKVHSIDIGSIHVGSIYQYAQQEVGIKIG